MNDGDAKRETQVNTQIKELNGSLDRLTAGVDKLQDRIGNILRDPIPDVVTGKEEEALVLLAHTIRNSCRSANRIGDQVEDIINRLEL